jgi:hypothetical protein
MGAQFGWLVATQPEPGLHCEQEPPAPEVDLGTSKHRSLEHLLAINLVFDRTDTPRQRQGSFHGLPVRSPVAKRRHGATGLAVACANQPCGAACRQWRVLLLHDERERLAWALLARP